MGDIRIPAEHVEYVGRVIAELGDGGLPVSEMYVEVRDGELELLDGDASYGVRRWET